LFIVRRQQQTNVGKSEPKKNKRQTRITTAAAPEMHQYAIAPSHGLRNRSDDDGHYRLIIIVPKYINNHITSIPHMLRIII